MRHDDVDMGLTGIHYGTLLRCDGWRCVVCVDVGVIDAHNPLTHAGEALSQRLAQFLALCRQVLLVRLKLSDLLLRDEVLLLPG